MTKGNLNMTILQHLKKSNIYKDEAKIVKCAADEKGDYCILDKTIFYPQGGGQPSDLGVIKTEQQTLRVKNVKMVEGEVRHYLSASDLDIASLQNIGVIIEIDKNIRLLHSRYHTAGQLIGNLVQMQNPNVKVVKAEHFPDQAYMKFDTMLSEGYIKKELEKDLNNKIKENLPVCVTFVKSEDFAKVFGNYFSNREYSNMAQIRSVKIGNLIPVPCGGTHVSSLEELKEIEITKVKIKKEATSIQYTLNP